MACSYEWIGIAEWWCRLGATGQAAWVQAIGTIGAVAVAVIIPYLTNRRERKQQEEKDRKVVMSAAAHLDVALGYQSAVLAFSPEGDGEVGHDFTLEQARNFMLLQPQTQDALEDAVENSHYFDEELCEKVIRLRIESASYERIIDDKVRRDPNSDPDEFFKSMANTKNKLHSRIREVRELLQPYLPKDDD